MGFRIANCLDFLVFGIYGVIATRFKVWRLVHLLALGLSMLDVVLVTYKLSSWDKSHAILLITLNLWMIICAISVIVFTTYTLRMV